MTLTHEATGAATARRGLIDGADEAGETCGVPQGEVDGGVTLVHPIPLGTGFAPSTRMRLEYPGERFEPFLRLRLVEPDGPTFWVVEPGRLFPDYLIEIPDADVEALGLVDATDAVVLTTVTPGRGTPTANLFAPIVVNRRTMVGAQVILEDSGYGCAVAVDSSTARPGAATGA